MPNDTGISGRLSSPSPKFSTSCCRVNDSRGLSPMSSRSICRGVCLCAKAMCQSIRSASASAATQPACFLKPCFFTCFNPRARAGRDQVLPPSRLYSEWFQPRRAGRDDIPAVSRSSSCFNHAARGATYKDMLKFLSEAVQSTRPRGDATPPRSRNMPRPCLSARAFTRGSMTPFI